MNPGITTSSSEATETSSEATETSSSEATETSSSEATETSSEAIETSSSEATETSSSQVIEASSQATETTVQVGEESTEFVSETAQPTDSQGSWSIPSSPVFYVSVGLALALITTLIIVILRLNKEQKRLKKMISRRQEKENTSTATNKNKSTPAPSNVSNASNQTFETPITKTDPTIATMNNMNITTPATTANVYNTPSEPVVASVYQHIGAREDQQDSYGASNPTEYPYNGIIAIVADGMGGLANGASVSSALVRTFLEDYSRMANQMLPQNLLLEMALHANTYINQMLQGAQRSGSTLVSAIIQNGYLYFLTVGDSRIYLYRNGALLQLNREHIYQEELAVKAINHFVPMSQVTGDRQAHSLTSYFGIGQIPSIDRNYEGIKLMSGDRILLASDGVFGTLTQEQMEQAQFGSVNDATSIIGQMILSENKPHQDNNTIIILEYRG